MKPNHQQQKRSCQTKSNNPSEFYEILVQGQLDSMWGQWFEGMVLSHVENDEHGPAYTLISGQVADQSALHGLLIKIRDLNLKLISVRRILPDRNSSDGLIIDLKKNDLADL